MSKEHIWEIKVGNTPLLKKKCNRCGSDRFYCSEKFRINSHKKNIDVWLIYRCIECENTYNLTLFSRSKQDSVHKNLFNKFLENDTSTAWEYAFSPQIAKRNNVELDFHSVEYKVRFEDISIEDIVNSNSEIVTFNIICPFDFGLKLSSVIRTCLKISANQLSKLIESKAISVQKKYLQKKHKVKKGDVVQVHKVNIQLFLLDLK